MTEIIVSRGAGEKPLGIRINGPRPTFTIETDRIEAAAVAPLEPRMLDLLEIVCAVFAADGTVKRGGATRPHMGERWRRVFDFQIPVRDIGFWSRSDVVAALVETVSFMTEDVVSFRFSPRTAESPLQSYLDIPAEGAVFRADEVILFSGGLDSLAGALEALSTRSGRVILVTHLSSQKMIKRQETLGDHLAARFPGRVLHVRVRARRKGDEAKDATQRSRSFLFGALGVVVAHLFGARRVSFYENGVISHNLPISPQVIGTMATRTTHPQSLRMLDALMALVTPDHIPIRNPYAWLTKAEVVQRIADHDGESLIAQTVSCTSIREQDTLHTHCGACSQCIDRRFAILATGFSHHDPAEMYRTDVLFGPRDADASRAMAVDWTRHAIRLHGLDEPGFLKTFGQEVLRILRGHPDLEQGECLRRLVALQKRHASTVVSVLEATFRSSATALATGAVPPSSLIAMHAGGGVPDIDTALRDPRLEAPVRHRAPNAEAIEDDLVPDPDRPLEVAFFEEKGRHMIAVLGLCRVIGRPAHVAHVLKLLFDEDRAAGRTRNEHCYMLAGHIGDKLGVSKGAVAKSVDRCRDQLEAAFHDVHGRPPMRELLIETRKPRGYRLDPEIRPVAPPDPDSPRARQEPSRKMS